MKSILEKSQFIPKFNPPYFGRVEDQFQRPQMEIQTLVQNTLQNPEINIPKPIEYYRDNYPPKINHSLPPFGQEGNFIQQNHQNQQSQHFQQRQHPDYLNPFKQAPTYTPPPVQQNCSYARPQLQIQHPSVQTPVAPKIQIPKYEHPEQNLKVSLKLPYQIMMSPMAEMNQNISINNLPSLNDLAIRTGISNSLNTIIQRDLCYPRGSELILPLSSLYQNNYPKYPSLGEIQIESKLF